MDEDGFALADGNTNNKTVDALNNSFNSISEMVDEYTNYSTPQDYGIIYYQGSITNGESFQIVLDEAAIDTPVWGMLAELNNSGFTMVGTLRGKTLYPVLNSLYAFIYQPYRLKV